MSPRPSLQVVPPAALEPCPGSAGSPGARDPLRPPDGARAEATLRRSIRDAVTTLEALLCEPGRAPPPREDAAAGASRTLARQWLRGGGVLDDGRPLTVERFRAVLAEEMGRVRLEVGEERFDAGRFEDARTLFERMSTQP